MPRTKGKQNLIIGSTEIVFRQRNGRYKSDLRSAQFYQVRQKNKRLSALKKFPKDSKTVKQKRIFIIKELAKAFLRKSESAKKAQIKREEKARTEGREYKPRRQKPKVDLKTFLGADKKTLESITELYPELSSKIEKRDEEEVIPESEWAKMYEDFQKTHHRLYRNYHGVLPIKGIDPYSTGRALPVNGKNKPLKNWFDDQVELGLIKYDKKGDAVGKGSIRWIISRYHRSKN